DQRPVAGLQLTRDLVEEVRAKSKVNRVAPAAHERAAGRADGRDRWAAQHADQRSGKCPQDEAPGTSAARLLVSDPAFGILAQTRRGIEGNRSLLVQFIQQLGPLGGLFLAGEDNDDELAHEILLRNAMPEAFGGQALN